MSNPIAYGLALDHIALIQSHINALDRYAKGTALTDAQRSALNKRRQGFELIGHSAAELFQVIKADFVFEKQKEQTLKMQETLRRTRALSFDKWKVLKDNNLLHLLQ